MKMAVESVFGGGGCYPLPPSTPVMLLQGGAIFTSRQSKRGEIQSNSLYYDFSDETVNEEGEIEDGEIVDSQDEDNGAVGGGGNGPITNLMNNGQARHQTGGDGQNVENARAMTSKKKKKKKRNKRKRPLALLMELDGVGGGGDDDDATDTNKVKELVVLAPPPAKKPKERKMYVDHDRVEDDDPTLWCKFQPPPMRGRQPKNGNQYDSALPPPPPPSHSTKSDEDFEDSPFGRSPPPVHRRSRSPPGLYDSPYESDENDGMPSFGGDGWFGDKGPHDSRDGPQRRHGRNSGGGGGGKRNQNGRGRNKKRTKGGRGGNNRGNQQQQQRREKAQPICKFYKEGKCHKGSECIYKHDGEIPKKMDICKFYLNSTCSKGDSCIFMHHEYPCKFFHSGAECFSADNCKFSHDPLTDHTRYLLEKCWDKGDDDDDGLSKEQQESGQFRPGLLGSPPHKYGGGPDQCNSNPNLESHKGIPSLFDIRVEVPLDSKLGQSRLSPSQHEMHNMMTKGLGFYSETGNNNNGGCMMGPRPPLLPLPYGCGGMQPQARSGYDRQQPTMPGMLGSGSDGNSFCSRDLDHDERVPYFGNNVQDTDMRMRPSRSRHASEDPSSEEPAYGQAPWHSPDADDNRGYYDESPEDFDSWDTRNPQKDHGFSSDSESDEPSVKKEESTTTTATAAESSNPSDNIQIPIHLPKKQRELFLRIQQQQREAEKNIQARAQKKTAADVAADAGKDDESDEKDKDKDGEKETSGDGMTGRDEAPPNPITKPEANDEEDSDDGKENWYSSDDDDDDEDRPLTDVLKKLQQQPILKSDEQQSHPKPASSVFNIAKMIQSISSQSPKSSVTAATDVGRHQQQTPSVQADLSRDPRAQRSAVVSGSRAADPRARDPRSKPPIAPSPPVAVTPQRRPEPIVSSPPPTTTPTKKRERRPSVEMRSPEYSMPYKLISVSTSHIDYGYVLNSSGLDPTLLLKDPRLTRQLANKINSETPSDPKKKPTFKDPMASVMAKGEAKSGSSIGVAATVGPKPGLHRLGVMTMPGPSPLRDPSSSSSYGISVSQSNRHPKRQFGSLDDVDELWSVDEDNVEVDLAPLRLVSRPTSTEGHRDYRIVKKTASKMEETTTAAVHPSRRDTSAKIRSGGLYPRRTTCMDYASPLGGFDDDLDSRVSTATHASGYDSTKKITASSRSSSSTSTSSSNRSSSSSRVAAAAAISVIGTLVDTDDANKPLKEIFKTIDPTASPFC